MWLRRGILPFLVVGASALCLPARAQQAPDYGHLEKTVLAELAETGTPGAAIAIVSGDRVVYARGFGTSNVETGAAVTADMLFRIGSATKMFTTTALVMLAEQGRLRLDAPIGQYMKGLSGRLGQVSAHQLMSHTAGLRDEAPGYGTHDPQSMGGMVRTWTDAWFFTQSGRVFSYSNPGFTLAGLLAEELSGRPYARLLDELLFKPLGMTGTTFEPTVAMTRPLSQGHNVVADRPVVVRPFADNAGYWPAGFLFSSVNDLAKFAIAFMNGGRIDGRSVIPGTVITKLSSGYALTHSGQDGEQYGYGLQLRDYRGVHLVEHGGSIAGFGALVRMVPEQQFAVIVLTNRSGGRLPRSTDAAMQLWLKLKPVPASKASVIQLTPADLNGLPGRYAQGLNVLEILQRDGALFLKQGSREAPLKKIADHRFEAAFPQRTEFVIVRGTNGRPEYLHTGLRALARQP